LATDPAPQGLNRQLAARQQRGTEGRLAGGQAQEIGGDPHLAVAGIAGADADHGQGELLA